MSESRTYEKDANWQEFEKLVAMLEKAITPNAQVSHNVYLPVIGSKRRKRQFDVVIYYGETPRKQVAVVEVQDRNRKVGIAMFEGWVAKMHAVGAQQLICVSAKGYDKSVIEEVAEKHGPSVVLMTLQDPNVVKSIGNVFLLPYEIITHPKFEILNASPIKLDPPLATRKQKLYLESKSFSTGEDAERLSLNELLARSLTMTVGAETFTISSPINLKLLFPPSDTTLYYHTDQDKHKVINWEIDVKIWVIREKKDIVVSQYVYRQVNIDGALAWVADSTISHGGEIRSIRIMFKADGEAFLRVSITPLESVVGTGT